MRVLSIGTGLGDVVSIQNTRWSILDALKTMATSSKKVAARLESRFSDTGQYYRFNVERGLEDITLSDWEKTSKISAHTHNYLQENRRAVKKFVDNFLVETEHGPGGDLAQAEHGTAGGGRPKSSSPFTEQGQPVSSRQPSVGRDVLTIPSPAARSGTQETQVSVASAATAFEEVSRVTKLDRSPDEDQKGGTWTILHAAVRMNNFQGVATILARGFDPNSQDERGLTPILVAACLGLLEISQRLVGAGAKVNITSFLGSTPLREAAAIGAVKLVQFLLESGADLELAPHEHRDTPLITAAAKNHLEVVNLLLAAGANTRAQTNGGWSPLHYALFSKNKDMAIEILQHNPDVNSSTIVGLRPLHLAAIAGFPAICAQMLDLGAEMDATDDGGVTALRAAVQEGQLEVVKFLVENGSRTDVLAADRHSLCDMALIFGQEAVYQYLEGRVTAG